MASPERGPGKLIWPVDFNVLPSRFRPHPWILRSTVLMLIVALALAGSAVFLINQTSEKQSALEALERQQEGVQKEIEKLQSDPDTKRLRDARAQLEAELQNLVSQEADYSEYEKTRTLWAPKLQQVIDSAEATIGNSSANLLSMEQTYDEETNEYGLVILGESPRGNGAIVDFASSLKQSGMFAQVDFWFTPTAGEETGSPAFQVVLLVQPGSEGQ